jgi:hypothetical protein
MGKFQSAFLALCLALAAAPAQAERLHFEGSFTNRTPCGFDGECDSDRMESITPVPFSFVIDLAFDPNQSVGPPGQHFHEHRRVTSTSPRFAPPVVPQSLWPREPIDKARFDSYANPLHTVLETQQTSRAVGLVPSLSSFSWQSVTGQFWQGDTLINGVLVNERWSELVNVAVSRVDRPSTVTFEQASQPVTFTELLGLLDGTLVPGGTERVQLSALVEYQAVGGAFDFQSSEFSGDFRLASIQCRTPQGLGDKLATLRTMIGL